MCFGPGFERPNHIGRINPDNNELFGPVVAAQIGKYASKISERSVFI